MCERGGVLHHYVSAHIQSLMRERMRASHVSTGCRAVGRAELRVSFTRNFARALTNWRQQQQQPQQQRQRAENPSQPASRLFIHVRKFAPGATREFMRHTSTRTRSLVRSHASANVCGIVASKYTRMFYTRFKSMLAALRLWR